MTVSTRALRSFIVDALVTAGADWQEAETQADIMVWSDAMGRDTQGVWRLPMMVERLQNGLHTTPVSLEFEEVAPSLCRVDGQAGLGYVVATQAMDKAIDLAASQGIGCVAVANSSHLGAAGYYVFQAAERQMVGLCFSNSIPRVVPPGGTGKVWGTNPLAIGCPRQNGQHVLIDMATAATAGSTMTKAEQAAQHSGGKGNRGSTLQPDPFPPGGTSPMAGGKGFALGFAVELLSALITGAGITHELRSMHNDMSGPAGNGHLMMAIHIERLMSLDCFYARLEGVIGEIHQAGGRVPGELRWQTYGALTEQGIELEPWLLDQLSTIAEEHSLPLPW
ncbi:Ldh family oxidoreductase [Marinobacter sp. F4216]|uniref:Ldh family oxidoreductase n=1 Tax=Marinobacter sp. F4216 TaxID=2874281 RepID=UPI001CBE1C1B|nr:Ldh family oxidoreductase [Marinobacter sp. F4216]MBZ2168208.1 Ldh family oxidoreductase [Marinobacter sp. F4216]